MPFPQAGPCNVPLDTIIGTGFNTVNVPDQPGAQYKSTTEQLLYEIWQGILQLLAATNPPGMVTPITFTIGDAQPGTPANGATALSTPALQGQSLVNKTLLVIREGIVLMYSDADDARQIVRINTAGGDGGFSFDPASGLSFQTGESYQILTIGTNTATT